MSYLEIRKSCLLLNYVRLLAADSAIWVEIYTDGEFEYRALFPDNLIYFLPLTITKTSIDD